MNYESVLSERARREMVRAWQWYEDRSPGLGDRFIDAIFRKIRQIEADPGKGMQRRQNYKEAMLKVFPYLILYRIEAKDKMIFIHSIFHTRRNPRKKYTAT